MLLQPLNANIDLVERAPVTRALRVHLRILRRLTRRRDPQVLTHECATRHVTRWQYDLAHCLALGADAQHLAVTIHSLPDVAFDVNGESVGFGASVKLPENAWVAYSTGGGVEVVGVYGSLRGVYEVERGVGEGPADAVGNDEFGAMGLTGEAGVET